MAAPFILFRISSTSAGFVNNLNDGMPSGLFPVLFASAGMELAQIGWLTTIYPAVWGGGQLFSGALSDRWGRKGFIVYGMWLQAVGIVAALGDIAHPSWRASAVGIFWLWRDSRYAVGAILAGLIADYFGLVAAIWSIAVLILISGTVAAVRLRETRSNGRLDASTRRPIPPARSKPG